MTSNHATHSARVLFCFLAVRRGLATPEPTKASTSFNLETATIADIDRAMDKGSLSSEPLVRLCLARIRGYEPSLLAIITLNPNAIAKAQALDEERRHKGRRSHLHGIPVRVSAANPSADKETLTFGQFGMGCQRSEPRQCV